MYDLIIVGGGVVGLSAAMYAGRLNMKTALIGDSIGGTIMLTDVVENYPGFERISGTELAEKFRKHAENYDIEIVEAQVESILKKGKNFTVKFDGKAYETKTVLVATGTKHRPLDVPGEKEFEGNGVHSCALCLLPDTQIVTNPSTKQIKDINNDRLLTHEGKFENSVETLKRQYNGEIIRIIPKYFHSSMGVTPEHPILAAVPKRTHHNYRAACRKKYGKDWVKHLKEFLLYKPEWVKASDLKKGDFLLYPVLKETKDIKYLKISDFIENFRLKDKFLHNIHETHTSVKVPDTIKIDNDFMRLAGYYLAEGHVLRGVHFSFSAWQKLYANEIKKLVKKIFGLECHIKRFGNVLRVSVYSNFVGDLFSGLFGKLSYEKNLPSWMLYLPVKKQANMFTTMWFGDGYKRKKRLHYVTTSKKLADQLKIIFLRMGVVPNIYVKSVEKQNKNVHRIDGRAIIAKHDKYEIEIGGPSLATLCKLTGIKHEWINKRKSENYYTWFDYGYALIPVRKIEKEWYKGEVYDLAVNNSHSFTTDVACVHNCDGYFYKDKTIAVVGGSDSAGKDALLLTQWGKKVYIIYRGEKIHPEPVNMKRIEENKKIEIISRTNIIQIKGGKTVKTVVLDRPYKNNAELMLDAVFIEIGFTPASQLAEMLGVKVNEKKEIMIDRESKTNVPGVFAAGDVVDAKFKQVITGVGEAVSAVYSAYRYVNENGLANNKKDD